MVIHSFFLNSFEIKLEWSSPTSVQLNQTCQKSIEIIKFDIKMVNIIELLVVLSLKLFDAEWIIVLAMLNPFEEPLESFFFSFNSEKKKKSELILLLFTVF